MAKYWYTPRQSYSAPYSFSKNCLTKPKIEFRRNFSGMPACEHVCMCICMYVHAYGSQKSTLGVIISNWILCFWGRVSLIWNSLRKLAWLASDPSDPCVCVSLPSAGTTSVCYNAWLLFVCGARDWTQVVMLTKQAIYWLATPGHNIGVFTHSPLLVQSSGWLQNFDKRLALVITNQTSQTLQQVMGFFCEEVGSGERTEIWCLSEHVKWISSHASRFCDSLKWHCSSRGCTCIWQVAQMSDLPLSTAILKDIIIF